MIRRILAWFRRELSDPAGLAWADRIPDPPPQRAPEPWPEPPADEPSDRAPLLTVPGRCDVCRGPMPSGPPLGGVATPTPKGLLNFNVQLSIDGEVCPDCAYSLSRDTMDAVRATMLRLRAAGEMAKGATH